jgi:hypothetical protein
MGKKDEVEVKIGEEIDGEISGRGPLKAAQDFLDTHCTQWW